jgi:hypothetical protein
MLKQGTDFMKIKRKEKSEKQKQKHKLKEKGNDYTFAFVDHQDACSYFLKAREKQMGDVGKAVQSSYHFRENKGENKWEAHGDTAKARKKHPTRMM